MSCWLAFAIFYRDVDEAKTVFDLINEYNSSCDEVFRAVDVTHCKIVKPLRNHIGKLIRRGFVCLFAVNSIVAKTILSEYFAAKRQILICLETLVYSMKLKPGESYPLPCEFCMQHFGPRSSWFVPHIEQLHGKLSDAEMETKFLEFIERNNYSN